MSELVLVTHNVGSRTGPETPNSDPDQLRDNLARLAGDIEPRLPHVLALQEATRLRHAIHGYQRVAIDFPDHPDDLGCQLLVRDDVEVIRRRLVAVGGPWWTGPKHGLRHPPKVFVGATVELRGQRWDVLSVHRVWTGPHHRNADTWRAERDALMSWIPDRAERDHGTRPVITLGDWNDRGDGMAPLVRSTGGQLAMRGIDGALGVNCHLKAHKLDDRYGSDGHEPVVVSATAE